MTDSLCILICEHFAGEAAAVIDSEGLDDVTVTTFPAKCMRQQITGDDLARVVRSRPDAGPCCFFRCNCIAGLEYPSELAERCRMHNVEHCFHLLAPASLMRGPLREGAYLLTPGWLSDWREKVGLWGFDEKLAREFFSESATRLLLLDTGVDEKSIEKLRQFAAFVDRPFDVLPVGLDYFRLLLKNIVLEWRSGKERDASAKALNTFLREKADYAMAMDVFHGLSHSMTEREIVDQIFTLSSTLFAPGKLAYMPFEAGEPGEVRSLCASAHEATVERLLACLAEGDFLAEPEGGLCIRLTHRDEHVGVLYVGEIAMPEFREHYLNLALSLAGVFGLAIGNARVFERIMLAEKKLKDSHDRLKIVLDSIEAGIYVVDADTKVILFGNRHIRKIFGEVEGKVCWRVLRTGQSGPCGDCGGGEFRTPLAGRWYSFQSQRMEWVDGRPILITIVVDITERKELERLREDVDILMRHDLKTPLNSVIGLPQVMMSDDNLTPEQMEYLKLIREAGYRILNQVNLSLDLYKMETGGFQYEPRPVESGGFLKRLLHDVGFKAGNKGVGLEALTKGAPWEKAESLLFQADEAFCYAMLSNLLDNAVDASPIGARVMLRLELEPGAIVFSIHNTGVVAEAVRDTFFDKYATHGKSGGTGLGTYSAKLMAEAMGGSIGFISSETEGTTVTVRLPRG